MRLRLAGGEQLGAYTPRPRAPSDSLMSLQVHESAPEQRAGTARSRRPHFHAARVVRPSARKTESPAVPTPTPTCPKT